MKDKRTVAITNLMKRNSCGKALEIARGALETLGSNGMSDEFDIALHLDNLEVVNTCKARMMSMRESWVDPSQASQPSDRL